MVCVFAIALLLLNPNPAKAESREQAVDRLTDYLFYRVNPQLNNRKLQTGDREYIRQWQKLREAIAPRVKSVQEVCFRVSPQEKGWEFTTINGETYEQTYDRLADTIFYSRHPQRIGQQIPKSDRISISEWSAIRREMYISNCGL
ncbi:MAG: hypothetical protein JGK21_08145 [Microcoleus sp. PH2017_22_RUC_O_B]|nr:hypothetical protein [Microcoleus sp. PH2017_21_RUC_O_A]MCC3527005.1 hypothetical protein [Microcoleus sp. PH2017_21_RUC_O_A]MCC3540346.1 hypothetical protein [Microcoleus sp. PH2017_22_RUC_O_B]